MIQTQRGAGGIGRKIELPPKVIGGPAQGQWGANGLGQRRIFHGEQWRTAGPGVVVVARLVPISGGTGGEALVVFPGGSSIDREQALRRGRGSEGERGFVRRQRRMPVGVQ